MTGDSNPDGEVKRYFGLFLMIAGVMWLATTGLCTLVFASIVIRNYALNASDILTMLLVAAPSALIGYAIFAIGRWLKSVKS